MIAGHLLTAINDGSGSWTCNYRLGDDAFTIAVPEGESRQVVATHYYEAPSWVALTSSQIISVRSGLAPAFEPSKVPQVIEAITILLGCVCALAFWQQLNPFRR